MGRQDDIRLRAESLAKRIVYRTPGLRRVAAPSYGFGLDPVQLAWLVQAMQETRGIDGAVVEIGVARGMTTVFLNEALTSMSDPRDYICIDTFSGFTDRDVEHEQAQRGKQGLLFTEFSYNDREVFEQNMARLDYTRVRCLASDVAALTPADVGPVSVAVIDVDLYMPSAAALKLVWECLLPGGRLLVDDVKAGTKWDGSLQALEEFAAEVRLDWEPVGSKGGGLAKPSAGACP